jgi:site-specific DNA recombinase
MIAPGRQRVRCAIYTRVSTSDQGNGEFSSIDNQRESAEAYIASQASAGWTALDTRYDDAGFSGGTMSRPALERLLRDVESGLVDIIVVQRLDRLSRSLLDFTKLVQHLEKLDVGFVSTTQHFDTSSSMGKFTLNILMSFAEFERAMVSDRTRDKMIAAKRKGRWIGGKPPLGYDVHPDGGRLVVNENEAERVRSIFELYRDLGSLTQTLDALRQRGWKTKSWETRTGAYHDGSEWTATSLRNLLANPLYVGKVRCRGKIHPGKHDAILDRPLWDAVQRTLERNGNDGGRKTKNRHGRLLRGLIHCAACGATMSVAYATKGSKRYHYYRCNSAQKRGATTCPTGCIPATEIEKYVVAQIRKLGQDPTLIQATAAEARRLRSKELKQLRTDANDATRTLARLKREEDRMLQLAGKPGRVGDRAVVKLEVLSSEIETVEKHHTELQGRIAELEARDINPAELGRLLRAFDPIWSVLYPRERARVIQLLIERIEYDGQRRKLRIAYSETGAKLLLAEIGGQEAAA